MYPPRRTSTLTLALVAVTCFTTDPVRGQGPTAPATPPTFSLAEVRDAINAGNRIWGAARIANNVEALRNELTEDFYAMVGDRRYTRDEFITSITQSSPNRRMVRFDMTVLTLNRNPNGWTAVILEKLETEVTAADGTVSKRYSMWVTRDGWRFVDGAWKGDFSIGVGNQLWSETPPFPDW